MLTGQALTASDLYQRLGESGFFISGISWTASETAGEGRLIEYEAGFDDPVSADGYNFGVKKIYRRRDTGSGVKKEGSNPTIFERRALNKTLEEGSYKALASLKAEITKAKS